MNPPKLHHFVPQFYLRRFVNASDKLWVWDRDHDHVFQTSPGGVAAETHFYRLSQYEKLGHDGAMMEKQFSALEAEIAAITIQWLDWLRAVEPCEEIPIPEENRRLVSQHLALQYLRTVDTREILAAIATAEGEECSPDEQRRIHTEALWDPQLVNGLTDHFYDSVWLFGRNQTDVSFITSDNPVTFRSADNRRWLRLEIKSSGTYAAYPLAPDLIMYCYPRMEPWNDKLDQFANCLSPVILSSEMVQSENTGQVFMASRFIFSNNNDFKLEREFSATTGTDIYASEECLIRKNED